MESAQQLLQHFSLNDCDAKLYLTLNTLGESTIATLMHKTELSRTAIYHSITTLMQKNLLTHRKIGRIAYYNTTHPQHLEMLIAEKQQHDAELVRNLKAQISVLIQQFQLVSHQPGVHVFEGKANIIKVYEELLEDKQNIDSIEDQGDMLTFIGDYVPQYISKRVHYGLYNRSIVPSTNTINETNPEKLIQSKHIDAQLFPFNMDIKINDKRVNIITFQQKTAVGISIIHPIIVANFKLLFSLLWTLLPEQTVVRELGRSLNG